MVVVLITSSAVLTQLPLSLQYAVCARLELLLLLLECSLLMTLFASSFMKLELLDWMLLLMLLSLLLSLLWITLRPLDTRLLIMLVLLLLLLLLDASSTKGHVSSMERMYSPSSRPTMLVIFR